MRAVNITFQHGHLYDTDKGERIIIEEGTNYILIYENESDVKTVKFERNDRLKTEKEIYNDIVKDSNVTHIKKIKNRGEYLYFFISAENENEDSNIKSIKQSQFRIKLLEDLFLYSGKDWKSKDLIEGGKLSDCTCIVDKSENDTMLFFENILAKSVTSVVKKTHIHYFGNAGSPSKNSFDSVYTYPFKEKNYLLEELRGFNESDRIR